ncbi:SDR family NAD(P)-dependent oxidoreductase, partial [Patescibacteria group bacterium]|nr:SDR family NAD(P)-dependent oxidoreductase [Patescibacteria group bacterium]
MFELKDKVILITGARRGMGKADALMMAKQGAKVAVTDINLEECQAVVDEIISQGGEAAAWKMDVVNKEEIDKVFDEVIKKWGRLDVLVNNAGIYLPKMALDMTEADWDKTLDINLRGQFFCAQRAAKEMTKNKWGR